MRKVLCLYAVMSVTAVAGMNDNRYVEINYTGVDIRQEELPSVAPVQSQPPVAAAPVAQTPDQVIEAADAKIAAASQKQVMARATGDEQAMREAREEKRQASFQKQAATFSRFRRK